MEQSQELRCKVRDAYSAAARQPEAGHAFPIGREFAEKLGYPADLLASLPAACSDAFSGVGNVSLFAEIPRGATILDLGCGAGLDSLIAGRRTGPEGRVVGIDFSFAMLRRASDSAREAAASNVVLCQSEAERLPLRDGSISVAMVNGIFNLNPARKAIFSELGRVMEPGGAVFAAELVLRAPLTPDQQASESNWFA